MSNETDVYLTIAMPAFNEEKSIEAVVRRVLLLLDQATYKTELLILDDASTDQTLRLVKNLASQDSRVRILTNSQTQGIAGFARRLVYEARGQWIFIGSADGETCFEDSLRFVKIAEAQNLDAVLGWRYVKNYTRFRQIVSYGFKLSALLFFGAHFKDMGWVQLYRARFFQPLQLYSMSPFISAERLLAGRRMGGNFVEISVQHFPRIAGHGRGASVSWILSSVKDIFRIRYRFFFFDRYYQQAGGFDAR